MMDDLKKRAGALVREINQAADLLRIPEKIQQLEKLREEAGKPNFWSDNKRAQAVQKEEAKLDSQIGPWRALLHDAEELKELSALRDESLAGEISSRLGELEKEFEDTKRQNRFTGPYDDHDVILSIHAGAGGTDAQDWAQMLLRMYLRWAETEGVKARVVDQSPGEEAGIKSADIEIAGGNLLYGKLSGEHGVHRLVRLSPFNADHLRQTSFAKVEVLPMIDNPDELELNDKDLKIDVFRAGGHGGQSVNTTDSAVRVTHLPTGITVAIQNERSQLQNKETALAILRSKLVQLQLEQHAQSLAELKGPNQSAEWGNQIRNYVLHPYKQVKDLRTGYESSGVEKVLDGEISPLIEAWAEHSANA